MIEPQSSPSPVNPLGLETVSRPKKSVGVIVLLTLLSLSNTLVLILSLEGWIDYSDHGGSRDDEVLWALGLGFFLTLIAIAGLVGAWMTRKWGPRLYVSVAGISLVLGLVLAGGSVSPISFVGIALAVGLWFTAESNW